MTLERQSSFGKISFQWHQDILSEPGVDESEHLIIADLNSWLEKGLHGWPCLFSISLRMLTSIWQWRVLLKDLCRASHRLSNKIQGDPLNLIASIAGSLLFLTQFISSQGPRLLLAISQILLSKNECLVSLTVALNNFQFSRLLDSLYLLIAEPQDCDHHCFECLVIFVLFEFLSHICSTIEPRRLTTKMKLSTLLMFEVSRVSMLDITSLMNSFPLSLPGITKNLVDWTNLSSIEMSIMSGAWSEERRWSGRMWWQSSLEDPHRRNIRLMTEFNSLAVSENLVGPGLVGTDNKRSKESAIIIKSSLIEEWKGKDGSQRLSLILKSPVMRRTLLMLTSVSLRYFKAVWEESE